MYDPKLSKFVISYQKYWNMGKLSRGIFAFKGSRCKLTIKNQSKIQNTTYCLIGCHSNLDWFLPNDKAKIISFKLDSSLVETLTSSLKPLKIGKNFNKTDINPIHPFSVQGGWNVAKFVVGKYVFLSHHSRKLQKNKSTCIVSDILYLG